MCDECGMNVCMYDKRDCSHRDKVYGKSHMNGNILIIPWICRKCGETGMEDKFVNQEEYDNLIKKFS